jgi:hypothetical protein
MVVFGHSHDHSKETNWLEHILRLNQTTLILFSLVEMSQGFKYINGSD